MSDSSSPPLPGFPPPVHALLLKACLTEGAPALAHWHEWRRVQDFDLIDPTSQRLVPLLHHNLARLGVPSDAPDMGRYAGLHRRTWYENAAAVAQAAAVIKELTAAGIPTLVLKGTALASAHYPAGGVRPVGDADLLVPAPHAPAALRLLLGKGWEPRPPRAAATLLAVDLHKRHGWEIRNPDGRGFDLHWRLLAVSADASLDTPFWDSAVPLNLQGTPTLTLSAPHHLLHVCVHGLCLGQVPAYHWVADAAMILRHPGPAGFDWDAFLAAARLQRVELFASAALRHLAAVFAIPIPGHVLSALGSARTERWQRVEFDAFTTFRPAVRRSYYCRHRLGRLRACSSAWLARPAWLAYLRMMQLQWEAPTLAHLPLAGARKLLRRMRPT